MTGQRVPGSEGEGELCRAAFPKLGMLAALIIGLAAGPAGAADPVKGGKLYSIHCAACHGAGGEPVWPGAPDFRRAGALLRTDTQLIALIKQGRGVMPSFLGVLRDKDLYDLLAFLRTLS